jgi:aspartyl-tRNA(Asn)/glutamyl-tRNA(Gln) amidotransferase subunit A
MYLSDIYTISVNLAGLPGMSIPCGFTKNSLPIGLQLIGRPFAEADLLAMGRQFEMSHNYHSRHPNL